MNFLSSVHKVRISVLMRIMFKSDQPFEHNSSRNQQGKYTIIFYRHWNRRYIYYLPMNIDDRLLYKHEHHGPNIHFRIIVITLSASSLELNWALIILHPALYILADYIHNCPHVILDHVYVGNCIMIAQSPIWQRGVDWDWDISVRWETRQNLYHRISQVKLNVWRWGAIQHGY